MVIATAYELYSHHTEAELTRGGRGMLSQCSLGQLNCLGLPSMVQVDQPFPYISTPVCSLSPPFMALYSHALADRHTHPSSRAI